MQLNLFFLRMYITVSLKRSENRSHDFEMICVFIYKF